MESDRRDFEHEIRSFLRALGDLIDDLRGTAELRSYADAIGGLRDALVASLASEEPNEERLKIVAELKPLLDQIGRHDWETPSLIDASRLVYVFQDAKFHGFKDGRVTI